jgi:hypothetical protein
LLCPTCNMIKRYDLHEFCDGKRKPHAS